MTLYLAGFWSGKHSRSVLSAAHEQLIEHAGESRGLHFYYVADGHELWVGKDGVQASDRSTHSTQILVKAAGQDTYWPYTTVCPYPSLQSEPDYIRNRIARFMTYPGAILRSVLERSSRSNYSMALYVSDKGERVYHEQLAEMRRIQGTVPRPILKPDLHVETTDGAVLRMWKHPHYTEGWDMRRFLEAVINSLPGEDYIIAHRNPKDMAESHGAFVGGYHSVLEAEFGLKAQGE